MKQRSDKKGIFVGLAAMAIVLGAFSTGCADVSARRASSAWSQSLLRPSGFVSLSQKGSANTGSAKSTPDAKAGVLQTVSKAVTDVVSTMVVLDPHRRNETSRSKHRYSRRGLQEFNLPLKGMTGIEVDRALLNHDGSTRVDLRYRSTKPLAKLSRFYRGYLEDEGFSMREINVALDENSPIQLFGERGGDQVSAVFTRDRGKSVSVANLRVKLEKKTKRWR